MIALEGNLRYNLDLLQVDYTHTHTFNIVLKVHIQS